MKKGVFKSDIKLTLIEEIPEGEEIRDDIIGDFEAAIKEALKYTFGGKVIVELASECEIKTY